MEYVSVDIGYGFVKAISSNGNRVIFPAVVGSGREGTSLGLTDDSLSQDFKLDELHIKINNKHYYVGEMAQRNSTDSSRVFERVRFHHEYTMILLNTAIQLVTSPSETEVVLFTGLPLDYYKSQVKDFEAKLKEPLPMIQWLGGHSQAGQCVISIKAAKIFPQALSAIWATLINADGRVVLPELMVEGNQIAVIDVGFRTTDVCVVEMKKGGGFRPLLALCDTIDIGVVNLHDNIKTAYKDKTGGSNLSESKVERILNTKEMKYRGKAVDFTTDVEKAHRSVVNAIEDRISKLWKEEADTFDEIFLLGGGGSTFKPYFTNDYRGIVDGQFANAIGYYRLGKMLMGERLGQ
ncbi:plasmid segregation actin-type ATPase ParM [Ureibacillus xyleni]|uniref:Plasmid segregation actin-type ATPase ParM n=1 Tax=Ureibacillus xyleni TaxID=614648 RepID=A0A285TLH5_9BACL|nr:ParM/StbA family protein [Ureibacillus xyleni]SOC21566.1 plasmid segregation actin-type ATPase ParM [Ureibacillus xyleni]